MPDGKSEYPETIMELARAAVPKELQPAMVLMVAKVISDERQKTLGYIDHFIESVEVEVEGRTRFSIRDINRECKKSMRYVRDQITGDFEQNWLPRSSTEENLQHD